MPGLEASQARARECRMLRCDPISLTCSWKRLQFPNFFDLKLGEAVSHGLPSFDCYSLGSVVGQLGVDRMAGFAGQQINFSILSFDSSGQPASDAVSGAFGVIGTAQVVGDVA